MRVLWFLLVSVAAAGQTTDAVIWDTTALGLGAGAPVGLWDGAVWQRGVGITPETDCVLTSIALPLSAERTGGAVAVVLAADDHDYPGAPIEEFTIRGIATERRFYTVDSAKRPVLRGQTRYWVLVAVAGETRVAWYGAVLNSTSYYGPVDAFRRNNGEWWIGNPYANDVIIRAKKKVRAAWGMPGRPVG
jgi:hypothetical protein